MRLKLDINPMYIPKNQWECIPMLGDGRIYVEVSDADISDKILEVYAKYEKDPWKVLMYNIHVLNNDRIIRRLSRLIYDQQGILGEDITIALLHAIGLERRQIVSHAQIAKSMEYTVSLWLDVFETILTRVMADEAICDSMIPVHRKECNKQYKSASFDIPWRKSKQKETNL
ncbi:hypothetical protein D3C78_17990 [compost metagenome]